MAKYKEDQGRLARMAAFWLLTLLCFFGSNFLFEQLITSETLREPIGGMRIPVISVDVSPAFLISSIVCVVSVFFVYRWEQKPKVADLLIDTEAELRKVTWPTMEEVINSSMVVIVFVLFLGVFLAFADLVLTRIVRVLLRV